MMPGAMPLRGQGQGGGPRAGTSMRGGPMGRGDYGKSGPHMFMIYQTKKMQRSLECLLVK